MVSGVVFDIRKFSIHDGPGIPTRVFLKGCPLSCIWCHNPESQSFQPELIIHPNRCIRCGACLDECPQADSRMDYELPYTDLSLCERCGACIQACSADARQMVGQVMSVEQVLAEIERDTLFYEESSGGVTFSGGEPLSQAHFLLELLKACKQKELHTTIDTCGLASWQVIDSIRPYVDLFLYDLKMIDEQQHIRYTGVSNRPILDNLEKLAKHGEQIILRVPVIPGITDSHENLEQIAKFAAALPGVQRLDLLPYHATAQAKYENLQVDYQLPALQSPEKVEMLQLASQIEHYGLDVHIGG